MISKNHGIICRDGNGFSLEDTSSNGIFVNYVRIKGRIKLNFGDVINIFGLHIVYLNGIIAVGSSYGKIEIDKSYLMEYKPLVADVSDKSSEKIKKDKINFFNRSPRNLPNINTDEIEIEARHNLNWLKRNH